MAATNFTPISLYYSTTAAATPSAGNLVAGELALNTVDEKLYFKNSAGTVKLLASNAGSTATVSSVAVSGGTTGLTTSGGPITTSGTITLAGTLANTNGGTGATAAFTQYGLTYASTTTVLATTAAGTSTTVLHGNASGAPTFGAVSLTADVSGILPVANGGTALSSGTSGGVLAYTASGTLASSGALTQYGVVIGGGAGAVPTSTAVGTATHVLTSNGSGVAPTFQAPAATGATKGQAIAFSIIFGL